MDSKNKQSIVKSFAWPVVTAVIALIFGIKYDAPPPSWIIGGFIWAAGSVYLTVLYNEDGEETILPYVLNAIGTLVISVWAASQ